MQPDELILIVEDELLIAEHISRVLASTGYASTCCVTNVEDAIAFIERDKPQLVLTDIMLLGNQTGIDLGNLLHQKYRIPFIYITSHTGSDMISKVKFTHPNAYLVKPFKREDLLVAIELALFNSSTEARDGSQNLMVKDGRATAQIPYDEILWLEAEGNYTLLNTETQKKRLLRFMITDLHQQLPENDFIRIHRSFVVNRTKITEFASAYVVIKNVKLPVGRTYRETLMGLIK